MQTTYALLALAVAMLFTLSMQANIFSIHERSIRNEYEVMAGALAISELERLELEDYSDLFSFQTVDPDTIDFEIEDLAVPFIVSIDVFYVDESGIPTGSGTDFTMVEVKVNSGLFDSFELTQERIFTSSN